MSDLPSESPTDQAALPDIDEPTKTVVHVPEQVSDFDNSKLERGQTRKLGPGEVQQVIRLLADGVSQTEIAKIVGVTQSNISYLKSRYEPTVDAARALIHARAGKVAREWLRAVPVAARKGDHRPARDWLTAAGVVAPEQTSSSPITINVGVGVQVTTDDDPFAQVSVTDSRRK